MTFPNDYDGIGPMFIIGGRQSGKTHRCLRWMEANPEAIMIVHSITEMHRLEDLHPDLKGRIVIATRDRLRGSVGHPVIVDNVELVLANLLGVTPDIITATGRV